MTLLFITIVIAHNNILYLYLSMVRNYKKKKVLPDNRNEEIEAAIKLVEEQEYSIGKAAREVSIPKEMLQSCMKKRPMRCGSDSGKSILNQQEEGDIVEALLVASKHGWLCGKDEIQLMVKGYLDFLGRHTAFKNNVPGKDWLIGFRRRHAKVISTRKPEIVSKARAENLTAETFKSFFALVESVYQEAGLFNDHEAEHRIFNIDESGFNTNPNQRKLYFKKSAKDAYRKTPPCGKAMYTVLAAGNAAGDYLEPLVVYKAVHLNESWTANGPNGARYAVSYSRWMSDIIFEQWFCNSFVPFTANLQKPVVLFFDGHGSHLTYVTISTAMREMIIIICLPPHTSHALQPLDVGVFGPLKSIWRRILLRFYRETRMIAVDKGSFPTLLKKLWEYKSADNLIGGFRGSGLWPFNASAVNVEKCIEGDEDDQPQPSTSSTQDTTPDNVLASPSRRILREAIVNAIAPTPSAETKLALQNSRRKRKRVQATHGEVLTTDQVAEHLRLEAKERKEKDSKGKGRKKATAEKKSSATTRRSSIAHYEDSESVVLSVTGCGAITKEAKMIGGPFVTYVINIAARNAYPPTQTLMMTSTARSAQHEHGQRIYCL